MRAAHRRDFLGAIGSGFLADPDVSVPLVVSALEAEESTAEDTEKLLECLFHFAVEQIRNVEQRPHSETKRLLPALADGLAHPSLNVRRSAARVMRQYCRILQSSAAPAAPALGRALLDSDAEIVKLALVSLAEIGPEARAAAADVVEHLGKRRAYWRFAMITVAQIGPAAEAATPDLVLLAAMPIEHMQRPAARALGRVGARDKRDKRVLTLLRRLKGSDNVLVRTQAAVALWRLKGEADLPVLLDGLFQTSTGLELMDVIDTLGEIRDPEAVAPLMQMLEAKRDRARYRTHIPKALKRIEGRAK